MYVNSLNWFSIYFYIIFLYNKLFPPFLPSFSLSLFLFPASNIFDYLKTQTEAIAAVLRVLSLMGEISLQYTSTAWCKGTEKPPVLR